jgi:hypothetical protein
LFAYVKEEIERSRLLLEELCRIEHPIDKKMLSIINNILIDKLLIRSLGYQSSIDFLLISQPSCQSIIDKRVGLSMIDN